jgi:hypothetical protein
MPFEDILDLNLNLTDSDIDKIDKLAAKAEKRLEIAQRTLSKHGGIYAGSRSSLPKGYEESTDPHGQIMPGGGSPLDLRKKTLKDEVKEQRGLLEGILNSDLGASKAGQALSFLRSPKDFILTLFTKQLPVLAGLNQFVSIIKDIIVLLTEPGMPLDVYFKNTITTLVNPLMDKVVRKNVQLGYTQEIFTTKAGTFNAREAYNTFSEYEKNKDVLNQQYAIRYSEKRW